jgi:hypothetical protein
MLDLSCISIGQFPAVLIDAQHCLMAAHCVRQVGSEVVWLNTNKKPRTAKLAKVVKVHNADLVVGILETPLPKRVTTALITGYEGPAVIVSYTRGLMPTTVRYTSDRSIAAWEKRLWNGESGSPVVAEVNGRTVIVAQASYQKTGAATAYYIDQIAKICRET